MAEGVVIRPERDADHPVIAEVVRAAFVRHPDEVASFVERIRASDQFIPELALVAEDSSGVIAHVMLSWVGVEGGSRTRILNLTPMSVRPDRQRMGVGARLIRDALGRAEEAGEPAVMVEGIPAYYPRFGFEQASALGFISPHPKIPDDAFMVKRLPGYSPDLAGRIVYPASFAALAVAQAPPPVTGSKTLATAGSPEPASMVLSCIWERRISPRESFAQLGAEIGPPEGAPAGQVSVIAVTPSFGCLPLPLR